MRLARRETCLSPPVRFFAGRSRAGLLLRIIYDISVLKYPSEIQLDKANTSDTEAAFLDLHLSISNDIVSTKIYDKVTALILKLSISFFWIVMVIALHHMESISLNCFSLL